MTPSPAQPQPLLSTSPVVIDPSVSPPPKSRLLLYLVGGLTLLTIIATASFKIVVPQLLQSKTSIPDLQDQAVSQSSGKQTENDLGNAPIYPNSSLVSIHRLPDCNSAIQEAVNKGYDKEAAKILVGGWCDGSEYLFKVDAPFEKVISWYENDTLKTGFKLVGGAGTEGINRYGQLTNGKQTYLMSIRKNEYSVVKHDGEKL